MFHKVTKELRCSVCQNESLADSQAMLAVDLRKVIYEKVLQQQTEQQIIHFVSSRYGDFVLYQPPVKASTAVLWLGPLLLVFLGIYAIAKLLKSH